MKIGYKISLIVFVLLLLVNFYIYRNRNNGYEYLNQCSYETIYPCCDSSDPGMKKWYRNMDIYPVADIEEGRKFSTSEFGIKEADTAYNKVYKIIKKLYSLYSTSRRFPDRSDFNYAKPLGRYKILKKGGYILGENGYTEFLHFFSRSNDVLIRHLHTTGHINEHVFNEVFLPEKNKWLYADVIMGIAAVRDKRTGELLNSADIMRATDKKEIGQLEINFLTDSSGVYKNADTLQQYFDYYFAGTNTLYYYYTVDLENVVYKPWFKVKHYFSKESWHETYTHLTVSNRKFYIKQAAALAGLISFLVFGYFFVRSKVMRR